MNKALMISIQPQHAYNIITSKKTLELRTWIPKGYVGWVYVYVTRGKPYLIKNTSYQWLKGNVISYTLSNKTLFFEDVLNGKVAFRFWFDEYDKIEYIYAWHGDYKINGREMQNGDYLKLQLNYYQLNNYLGLNKKGYAWHIKQLEIFDEPKELSEFYKKVEFSWADTGYMNTGGEPIEYHPIEKAPQRSVWVYII